MCFFLLFTTATPPTFQSVGLLCISLLHLLQNLVPPFTALPLSEPLVFPAQSSVSQKALLHTSASSPPLSFFLPPPLPVSPAALQVLALRIFTSCSRTSFPFFYSLPLPLPESLPPTHCPAELLAGWVGGMPLVRFSACMSQQSFNVKNESELPPHAFAIPPMHLPLGLKTLQPKG